MIWYEKDIQYLETQVRTQVINHESVVFYGSSSIRLWPGLKNAFPGHQVVNMGFGGSTLAGCAWFVDRVFKDIHPKALVFYAGDNDLGDGRNPEEVYLFFEAFYSYIRSMYPEMPFSFISVKPSPRRIQLVPKMKQLNEWVARSLSSNPQNTYIDIFNRMDGALGTLKRYYTDDELHMNEHGYAIWHEALLERERDVFGG